MPQNPYWSPAEIQTVRDALSEGATVAEAAADVGRSYSATKQKVWVQGIRAGRRGPAPDARMRSVIIDRLAGGDRPSDLARRLGVSEARLRFVVRELMRQGLLRRESPGKYRATQRWTNPGG